MNWELLVIIAILIFLLVWERIDSNKKISEKENFFKGLLNEKEVSGKEALRYYDEQLLKKDQKYDELISSTAEERAKYVLEMLALYKEKSDDDRYAKIIYTKPDEPSKTIVEKVQEPENPNDKFGDAKE